MTRNRYDTGVGVMLVMMIAATDANKAPSVLPEQSSDLADFHASRMRRYIWFSAVESLQLVPVLRFSREQEVWPIARKESDA